MIERVRSAADRDEISELRRQLRASRERERRAFDLGFAAAVNMHAAGANLERLRAAVRAPGEVPVFARGTRDFPPGPIISDPDAPTLPVRVLMEGPDV